MYEKLIHQEYYLMVFHSKSYVVQLYQYLRRNYENKFDLISTPCRLKAGCSYSLRFYQLDDLNIIKNILAEQPQHFSTTKGVVYLSQRVNKRRTFTKIETI
ncbi:DUF3343 domain-containing protein [Alkaliphilus metalliredigens]|nr:DUF3343 domain-containing protein [Alkaliphilus metalliredigens]